MLARSRLQVLSRQVIISWFLNLKHKALVSPITKKSAAEAAAPQLDANIQIVYADTAARLGVDSRKRVQGTGPSNPQ
jgi:hypothetical protein